MVNSKTKKYAKAYYNKNKTKLKTQSAAYIKKNIESKTKYIKSGTCPKCKIQGKFQAKLKTNKVTGKLYPIGFEVQHHKGAKYQSTCYLGNENTLTPKFERAIEK